MWYAKAIVGGGVIIAMYAITDKPNHYTITYMDINKLSTFHQPTAQHYTHHHYNPNRRGPRSIAVAAAPLSPPTADFPRIRHFHCVSHCFARIDQHLHTHTIWAPSCMRLAKYSVCVLHLSVMLHLSSQFLPLLGHCWTSVTTVLCFSENATTTRETDPTSKWSCNSDRNMYSLVLRHPIYRTTGPIVAPWLFK